MNIHKEGQPIIIATLIIFMVLFIVIAQFTSGNALYCNIVGISGLLIMCFMLFFFRYTTRELFEDSSVAYAPADGEIVAIEEVYEPEYLKRKCIKVSIFMSIWNVHVNRYPVSGAITYSKYHPGKYLVARHPKSSELNEHQVVVIKNMYGSEILVKQIAGTVARRVVCYAIVGEQVVQGDDMGFIKFGSRVDILLPENAEVLVKMNEKVIGNVTLIARIL